MEDGEGRNATLFKYILVLQNQLKLTKDVIRRVLNNTNQYVFNEPLDQYEMETILRDESFEKPSFFDDKKRFMHDQFAEFMCDRMNVVKINGQLHIYEDGIYVSGYKKIESEMIKIIPQLKNNQRKEVLAYLELIAEEKTTSDARYIGFANGIYDVVTDRMMDFSPEIVITNMLPWEYNKEAYNDLADHTLNRLACDDHQIRLLLEECIGYCMYRRNELGKAFVLTGDKSNGKSTFLDVLKVLLGEENISALDLAELGDRFSTAMMYNRLANIGDDIGDDFMQGNQVATFKKIVTGNRIKAERKGQDPFDFNPYVKLLFAANDIPRMRDKSGAVLRRLVIIPFNAKFTKQDPDYRPFIKYELEEQTSIEYLIKLGVDGLRRVLENSAFTESDSVNEQLSEYEEENNPILGFIKDNDRASIVNQSTTDVYTRYMMFCNDSGMNPMSKVVFIKNINKRMNICVKRARINGKSIKIFSEV
jgi:putative DNA primase/helicase